MIYEPTVVSGPRTLSLDYFIEQAVAHALDTVTVTSRQLEITIYNR